MVPNHGKKRLLLVSIFTPIDGPTLILRKVVEGKAFLMRPKHQFIYPKEENEFTIPNHEKKKDNYRNLCLKN